MMVPYIHERKEKNMKNKGALAMGISLCLLLGGCSSPTSPKEEESDSAKREESTSQVQDSAADDSWSALDRIAYYENVIQELNAELLTLKTQLYTVRVEYESDIESMKAEYEKLPTPQPQFTYTVNNKQVTVTGYLGTDTELVIPQYIDGFPVVAIADRAFQNKVGLRSVKIPEGVRQIGWFAFSGCVLLEVVLLPTTLDAVCYGAFENCSSSMGVHCKKGSYAEEYAKSYGLRVMYT
jgi:hypothetical protein